MFALVFVLGLLWVALGAETCGDPISCALNNIAIEVPDTEIAITDTATLYINNLLCNQVSIQSFPSRYVPPTTLGVDVDGLHVYCLGQYIYDTGKLVKYKGDLIALVSNTNFSLDFYLNKPPGSEFASEMSFSSCYFPSMNINVDFEGNKGVDFTPLSTAVQIFLSKFLNYVVCVKFADFVYYNGTYALETTINPALAAIIDSSPSPPPIPDFPYINWESTFLRFLGVDSGGAGENSKLIQQISVCVMEEFPNYIKQPFIDTLIGIKTNSSGVLNIPVNKTVPVRNGTFTIDSVSLIGLDSFKTISLIAPSPTSNISLATTIILDKFVILMNSTTASNPEQGFVENRQFKFALSNVTLAVDFALGVNQTHVQSLYFDQFLDPGCVLESIQFFDITSLVGKIDIDELSLIQISGGAAILEQNVVELFDNGFQLLTDGFGDLMTDLIAGVFQGTVRPLINDRIALSLSEKRANSTCIPHVVQANATHDYIVWYNNTIVKLVNSLIQDANGLNRLMGCITNHTGTLSIDRPRWSISLMGLDSFFNVSLLEPYPASTRNDHPYNLINSLGLGYCPGNPSPTLNPDCNPFAIQFVAKGRTTESDGSAISSPLYHPADEWLAPATVDEVINTGIFDNAIEHSFYHAVHQLVNSDYLVDVLFGANPDRIASDFGSEDLGAGLPAGTSFYLRLENFYLYVDLFAEMDKEILTTVEVNQMGTSGCVAQAFTGISVDALSLSVSNASLVINDGVRSRDFTRALTGIFDILAGPGRVEKVNANLATKVSQAPAVCQNGGVLPGSDDDIIDTAKKSPWQWQLTLLVAGCGVSLALLLYGYYYWGRTGAIACLRGKPAEHSLLDGHDQVIAKDTRSFYERWGFEDALVCQVRLPLLLRIGIVIAVVGNMGCFLNSNLDPNAVLVEAEVDLVDKVINPPPVFAFGLKSTVQDMWDAEVYPLAVLIAFFSGAWPYVKLAIMGVCWVAPSQVLSIKRREDWLRLMDILGKWSLIDFFVMVMMMCAFMFNLVLGENLSVIVTVVPGWGFYGFLLATMVSLGLGHIILACHRLIVEPKVPAVPNILAAKESLFNHVFKVQSRIVPTLCLFHAPSQPDLTSENGQRITPNVVFDKATSADAATRPQGSQGATVTNSKYVFIKMTYLGAAVTGALLISTLVILYFGTTLETFAFHFKGVTGLLLKDKADVNYSFNSVGTAVPMASGTPNDFSVRWMEACYFAFGIGMPAAFVVVLCILWFAPLSLSRQRLWFVVAEVLNAWSALDVFCISIAAALVEIQQFAAFIVGDSCDGINEILVAIDEKIGYDGEGKCFDVIATLKSDCWTIFLAAGMLIVVGIPSLSVTHWVIKDRIEHTKLWHSNSFQNNLNRAQDLLSASEKNGLATGVVAGYEADYQNVTNPLLPSSVRGENDASSNQGVRFAEPELAVADPANSRSHRTDHDDMTSVTLSTKLTFKEKFHSCIIRSLVYTQLIVVVDPADVRGLEAIGMGVANTISQSLRLSSSITAGMGPPVYTEDNEFDDAAATAITDEA